MRKLQAPPLYKGFRVSGLIKEYRGTADYFEILPHQGGGGAAQLRGDCVVVATEQKSFSDSILNSKEECEVTRS